MLREEDELLRTDEELLLDDEGLLPCDTVELPLRDTEELLLLLPDAPTLLPEEELLEVLTELRVVPTVERATLRAPEREARTDVPAKELPDAAGAALPREESAVDERAAPIPLDAPPVAPPLALK